MLRLDLCHKASVALQSAHHSSFQALSEAGGTFTLVSVLAHLPFTNIARFMRCSRTVNAILKHQCRELWLILLAAPFDASPVLLRGLGARTAFTCGHAVHHAAGSSLCLVCPTLNSEELYLGARRRAFLAESIFLEGVDSDDGVVSLAPETISRVVCRLHSGSCLASTEGRRRALQCFVGTMALCAIVLLIRSSTSNSPH